MTSPSGPRRPRPVLWLCALVALAQLATASGTVYTSDGAKRLDVARHLLSEGRVDIVTRMPETPVGRDGRRYAQYGIGQSLALIPFVLVGEVGARALPAWHERIVEAAASLLNLVVTLAQVVVVVLLARDLGFSTATGVWTAGLYAFATMAWQQGKDSFEHPLIALCVSVAFLHAHRYAMREHKTDMLLAALAMSGALITRYTSILMLPGLALVLVGVSPSAWRRGWSESLGTLMWFGLALVPAIALDLWYNALRFGHPFLTGQEQLFGGLFEPSQFLAAVWFLTLSVHGGLIAFNPVLLIALLGMPFLFRRHRAFMLGVACAYVLHLVFYATTKRAFWTGGWAWGPRFFVDVLPLISLGLAPLVARWRDLRNPKRTLAVGVIVLSIGIQVESVMVNYARVFAKKSARLSGESYESTAVRDALLVAQLRSLADVARLTLTNHPLDLRATMSADEVDPATAIDRFPGYARANLWWVYAAVFGAPVTLVAAYLAATMAGLVFAWRRLRAALRVIATDETAGGVCSCMSR